MNDTTEARVFARTLADLVDAGAIPQDEAHTDEAAWAVERSGRYQRALLAARLGDLGRALRDALPGPVRRRFDWAWTRNVPRPKPGDARGR